MFEGFLSRQKKVLAGKISLIYFVTLNSWWAMILTNRLWFFLVTVLECRGDHLLRAKDEKHLDYERVVLWVCFSPKTPEYFFEPWLR